MKDGPESPHPSHRPKTTVSTPATEALADKEEFAYCSLCLRQAQRAGSERRPENIKYDAGCLEGGSVVDQYAFFINETAGQIDS